MLGDVVNLSARLMQRAQKEGGGVLCDAATKYRVRGGLVFARFGTIKVKGKKVPVKVFRPYPENLGDRDAGSGKRQTKSNIIRASGSLGNRAVDSSSSSSSRSAHPANVTDANAEGFFDSKGQEKAVTSDEGNSDFLVTKTNSYGNRQKRVFRIVRPIQVLRTFDTSGNIKKELELRSIVRVYKEGEDERKKCKLCIAFAGDQKSYHCAFYGPSERQRFCDAVVRMGDDPLHSTALRGALERRRARPRVVARDVCA